MAAPFYLKKTRIICLTLDKLHFHCSLPVSIPCPIFYLPSPLSLFFVFPFLPLFFNFPFLSLTPSSFLTFPFILHPYLPFLCFFIPPNLNLFFISLQSHYPFSLSFSPSHPFPFPINRFHLSNPLPCITITPPGYN